MELRKRKASTSFDLENSKMSSSQEGCFQNVGEIWVGLFLFLCLIFVLMYICRGHWCSTGIWTRSHNYLSIKFGESDKQVFFWSFVINNYNFLILFFVSFTERTYIFKFSLGQADPVGKNVIRSSGITGGSPSSCIINVWAHHMFSRILNLRIFFTIFKLKVCKVACFSKNEQLK